MKRKDNSYPVNTDNPDVAAEKEHIKQLEDELLILRIEYAYLKELRRLRLEEETLQKKLDNAIKHTASCQYRRTFHSDQGLAY